LERDSNDANGVAEEDHEESKDGARRKTQKRTTWWNKELQSEIKIKKDAWKRLDKSRIAEDREKYVRSRDRVEEDETLESSLPYSSENKYLESNDQDENTREGDQNSQEYIRQSVW
ncbi:hypothetical protein ILUMI_06288, partial [Ignelater luminosus]